MSKITVVSYCHEAHKPWISFWAEQINKQTFRDFNILFIAHNWDWTTSEDFTEWNEALAPLDDDLWDRVTSVSFSSPPVIGEVIDHGCSLIETEYFAHWDIDDPMHPDRLQLQHDFLVANPDVDFLNARAIGFHGEFKGWPDDLHEHPPHDEELIRHLTDPALQSHDEIKRVFDSGYNCLAHGLMVYRPEIILQLGGFSRSDVKLDGKSPDFETWKKAMMAGYKFHRLPELLMMWRLDSSSIRHV